MSATVMQRGRSQSELGSSRVSVAASVFASSSPERQRPVAEDAAEGVRRPPVFDASELLPPLPPGQAAPALWTIAETVLCEPAFLESITMEMRFKSTATMFDYKTLIPDLKGSVARLRAALTAMLANQKEYIRRALAYDELRVRRRCVRGLRRERNSVVDCSRFQETALQDARAAVAKLTEQLKNVRIASRGGVPALLARGALLNPGVSFLHSCLTRLRQANDTITSRAAASKSAAAAAAAGMKAAEAVAKSVADDCAAALQAKAAVEAEAAALSTQLAASLSTVAAQELALAAAGAAAADAGLERAALNQALATLEATAESQRAAIEAAHAKAAAQAEALRAAEHAAAGHASERREAAAAAAAAASAAAASAAAAATSGAAAQLAAAAASAAELTDKLRRAEAAAAAAEGARAAEARARFEAETAASRAAEKAAAADRARLEAEREAAAAADAAAEAAATAATDADERWEAERDRADALEARLANIGGEAIRAGVNFVARVARRSSAVLIGGGVSADGEEPAARPRRNSLASGRQNSVADVESGPPSGGPPQRVARNSVAGGDTRRWGRSSLTAARGEDRGDERGDA